MSNELYHHGIKGQKWGVRRYQNTDGSYTDEGKRRRNGESSRSSDESSSGGKKHSRLRTAAKIAGGAALLGGAAYLASRKRGGGEVTNSLAVIETPGGITRGKGSGHVGSYTSNRSSSGSRSNGYLSGNTPRALPSGEPSAQKSKRKIPAAAIAGGLAAAGGIYGATKAAKSRKRKGSSGDGNLQGFRGTDGNGKKKSRLKKAAKIAGAAAAVGGAAYLASRKRGGNSEPNSLAVVDKRGSSIARTNGYTNQNGTRRSVGSYTSRTNNSYGSLAGNTPRALPSGSTPTKKRSKAPAGALAALAVAGGAYGAHRRRKNRKKSR